MNRHPAYSPLISHLRRRADGRWEIQDNAGHSQAVARLAGQFASKFGMESLGHIAGLLHDTGKESDAFQAYIRSESGYDASARPSGDHSHAYIGMLEAMRAYGDPVRTFLANPIAGHHRGLYDGRDLNELRNRSIPPEIAAREPLLAREAEEELRRFAEDVGLHDVYMLTRMLLSCLVDADRLDTEAFMNPERGDARAAPLALASLLPLLDARLRALRREAADSDVNRIRAYVLERCVEAAEEPRGIFSLTVPTGGGKTLSSLAWAMRHALRNNLDRVIISVPFTSIIEQTAQILKGIFGEEAVLEHHSLMDLDHAGEEAPDTPQPAVDNWDSPIVVTTNVQLFESLFSHRPSRCRKLHNICRSVIILDEAQALPVSLLTPVVESLGSLRRKFGCSILLCTASQPALEGEHRGTEPRTIFRGFSDVREIIPSGAMLHERLRRTVIETLPQPLDHDGIAARLMREERVLCVVNTRRDAREIFRRLPHDGTTLHLSKNMYPAHIKHVLAEIKKRLARPEGDIRVVSTQLVEAGVDIDFPVVYRQEAGLDSVLQSAGRCNREGLAERGRVYLFGIEGHPLPPGMIARGNDARKCLPPDCDPFAPAMMRSYFEHLYRRCDSFDSVAVSDCGGTIHRSVSELLRDREALQTVGESFRMISDTTVPVIIRCDGSRSLIERLRDGEATAPVIRRLAQYAVGMREHDLGRLMERGAVEMVADRFYIVDKKLFYGATGIKEESEISEETYVI